MSTGSHSPPATFAEPFEVHGPHCPRRPTLREILDNTSQPPWTLAAFMAYLSSNHCLETLEFTMDASRYRKHYAKMLGRAQPGSPPPAKDSEYVRELWRRLVGAYIQPSGAREVNLPSHVRDPILSTPSSTLPPPPETLDLAVSTIYELMEESVLAPFLNSFHPQVNPTEAYSQAHATVPSRTTSDESLAHEDRASARRSRHIHTSPSPPRQQLQHNRHRFSQHSSKTQSGSHGSLHSTPSPTRNHDRWSTRLVATTSAPTEGSHINHSYYKPSSSDQYLYKSDSASTGTGPGMTDDTGSVGSLTADSPPPSHSLSPIASAAQMAALQQQNQYHHQQQIQQQQQQQAQQQQQHQHTSSSSSSSFFTAHFEAADPKRDREQQKLRERERERAERERMGLADRGSDQGMWRKLGRLSGMKVSRKRSQGALGEDEH